MRNRVVILTAALVLASSCLALAQTAAKQPPKGEAQETAKLNLGTIDFGSRFTSVSGDEARYERYRDLRTGANINLDYSREGKTYSFESWARSVGYRDASYYAKYKNGHITVTFGYDRLPINYSYESLTPWVEVAPNQFTLDANARTNVQNKTLPGGLVGVTASAADAAKPSIYDVLATPFAMTVQRDTVFAAIQVQATERMTANASVKSYSKIGHQPWGASFAFNNANELPITVNQRNTDTSANLEWIGAKGSFRIGYDGSFFQNDSEFLVWDNPMRATDYNCNLVTPLPSTCIPPVLWDPNAYSNGNGPARGRMSLAPSNQANSVNATMLYKLSKHDTLSGTFYVTSMTQNQELAPWTINANIANPATYTQFPDLAELPRSTAEASVLYTNAAVNYTSRPAKDVNVFLKYRFSNRSDRTPTFLTEDNVRFDGVPEALEWETEHLNIMRNTFDANVSFTPIPFTAFRAGYTYDRYDRTGRAFSNMAANTVRGSVDSTGNQYFSVRFLYEYTNQKGSGFSETYLEDGGSQGGLRFYDEADRTRNRATLLLTLTPVSNTDVTFTWGKGNDSYGGPGHEFGLLKADVTAYTVGINYAPKPQIAVGFNYGRDDYKTNQESRNASPDCTTPAGAPCPANGYNQFLDPQRNWALDNNEKVNNFDLYLDLLKAIKKTDIRVGYTFSDSDNAFVHSGPRIVALQTNTAGNPLDTSKPCSSYGNVSGCFEPMPNVTNKWTRVTADLKYYLTEKVVLGAAWWYEKFDVTDWATIDRPNEPGTPRVVYLGGVTTGYGNRPYSGNTGFVRVIYLF